MEALKQNEVPTQKIYKDRAIWVGTFLGGPLAAGYLIAENFKVFNETQKAKITWIIAIIATIIIFSGVFLIPEDVKIPNQIIPLIYTGIAFYCVQYYQGQKINEHINSGGAFYGGWRTIGIGFIALLITFSIIICVLLSTETGQLNQVTKKYGAAENEIIYEENIQESEVNQLAEAFEKTTFFGDTNIKYVFLAKDNSTYEIFISCDKSIENDYETQGHFMQLRNEIQIEFPNNKIVFNLVAEGIDNVAKRIE
ncbi:hypothetical protein OIU80_13615 [Flavobacterium sp. LS1R47]|uniref:Uncharacterized protein n=1 Tax=Flavobacterium frigoritolerans TaxID=2987686 RepID=A0A9X2ZSA1_9FLAO|nr:hypothetical protein [Flavobacterium frigoritolerans]MCV9933323.1 hypothetical protein [Flavobacterium frigoritolerans]